MKTISKYMSTY
nr:unnamed protein product [Callosobruchus analis]